MVFNGMHPQLLIELDSVTLRPLSIAFERSWSLEEVSGNWKKRNVTPEMSSGRARRKVWGTTDQSALPQSLGR